MRYFMMLVLCTSLHYSLISSAFALEAPKQLNVVGTYHMTLTGIPVAKIWMAVEGQPSSYKFTANLKSRGVVRWFKRIKSLLVSKGVLTGHGWQVVDIDIHSIYPEETKTTKLTYDHAGALLKRELSHDDDPNYRPLVANEKLKAVPTYGDAFFRLRELLYRSLKSNQQQFSTLMYDAKRLMQVTATIEGEVAYELYDVKIPAYKLVLSRQLVDGFTEKEANSYAEGEPPLYLYMSKADYLPIALEIELPYGTFKALWSEE